MKPKITKLKFTYKREDSDIWVLNKKDIPVDDEKIKDEQIVHIAPGNSGGNHKHPRIEWFIGIGELEFYWLDAKGEEHKTHMNPNGELLLLEIPPYLPHAVKNVSKDKIGIIFELADRVQEGVEKIQLIK